MLPGLRAAAELELDMQAAVLRKLEVYDITVSNAEVVEAVDDGVYDTVYVRLSCEAMRRTMHGGTNRWLGGGSTPESFEEVWGFARRLGVVSRSTPGTLEGFCPQCGADLLAGGAVTACTSCGARLDDGSQDWAVSHVGSAAGWRPSDVPPPTADAPETSLAQMLDAVTGHFWRLRSATLHADASRLAGWATPEFLAEHAAEFRAARDGKRNFHAAASIGRIEWLGASDGKAWLRVQWRGLPMQARVPSFLQEDVVRMTPMVDDFVLQRTEESDADAWLLAAVHRVQGEVPCPEQLDTLDERQRLERLPVTTVWEREILLQTCVALLLRTGTVTGRRLAHVTAAADVFGIDGARIPELVRQVESEGAVLFGRDCKLPPDTLFRHLARVAVACAAMSPAVVNLLRDVAAALGVAPSMAAVLGTERGLLTNAVRRIEQMGRQR
jgi:predicted lipid-binding transport protein (Tim44 family)